MPLDIPIIGACECLAYLHTVLDILLLPLTSTILFTTAIERYYCIVYAERYAYSGASCTFNIHVIAVLLAIPAAAYELYGLLLSSAMVRGECPPVTWMERTAYVAVHLQGAGISFVCFCMYIRCFNRLLKNYSTAPLSRDPEKAQVTTVTALVLASYILLVLFPEFVALPQSSIQFRWIAAWIKLSRGLVNAIVYLVFIHVSGRHSLRSLLYWKKTSSTPVVQLTPPERRA